MTCTPTRRRPAFLPSVEGIEPRRLPSVAPAAALVAASGSYNTTRYPAERRDLSPDEFPNLGRRFEVLAPFSDRYNCIAWSVGVRTRWISPATGPAKVTLAWADRLYGRAGYARSDDLDATLEPGVAKVVVYGIVDRRGQIKAIKHAAVQGSDGTWTSKMGYGGLIRHPTPQAVSGPLYGRPILVYTRAVQPANMLQA